MTKLEIANAALLQLGHSTISAITGSEATVPHSYINAFWPICRRELLRRHPWDFAIVEVDLVEDETAADEVYDYGYTLPADHLVPLCVNDDPEQLWEIRGALLVTNLDTVNLRYVGDNDTPAEFSSEFCDALYNLLAAKLAMPITTSPQIAQTMFQLADLAYRRATTADSRQGTVLLSINQGLADARF